MLENSIRIKGRSFGLLCIVIVAMQAHIAVRAEQIKTQLDRTKTAPKKLRPPDNYQKLKTAPIDFPGLPVFPGKTTFIDGYYLPNKNGSTICQMSYFAQEDTKAVLDFYKDAFSGNGWKLLFAAGPTITARHQDGHMCTVNVVKSKLPQTKSQFTIAYRQLTK